VDTRPEHFPALLLHKKNWPAVRFSPKRAITLDEHQRILENEKNPEWNAYYRFCWHLGPSQSDVAGLIAEDIQWKTQTIAYRRRKTGVPVVLRIGEEISKLLREELPTKGPLFPRLSELHEKHRAKLFNRRCRFLGIKGVTLHSYRYGWAERAMICGYLERFAQAALVPYALDNGHRREISMPNRRRLSESYSGDILRPWPKLVDVAGNRTNRHLSLVCCYGKRPPCWPNAPFP